MTKATSIAETEPAEIMKYEPAAGLPPTLYLSPQERIKQNKALIEALAPQVQAFHLSNIGGKAYMNVGGGIAVANAMGYAISVLDVVKDEEVEAYKAIAVLHCASTGAEIARATGYVGFNEDRWMKAPTYARLSMTQTRAEAKLCAANFRSVYTMLGAASDTPAEEMAGVVAESRRPDVVVSKKQRVKQRLSPPSTVAAAPSGETYTISDVRTIWTNPSDEDRSLILITTACGGEFKTFDAAIRHAAEEAIADQCECTITSRPSQPPHKGVEVVSFQAFHEAVEEEEIQDGLEVEVLEASDCDIPI